MNGMPIGPPFHVPDPKSACRPVPAPVVLTIDEEFDRIGSVSTGVFQMLSAGRTEHDPIVCWANPSAATHDARTQRREIRRTGTLLSQQPYRAVNRWQRSIGDHDSGMRAQQGSQRNYEAAGVWRRTRRLETEREPQFHAAAGERRRRALVEYSREP